MEPSAQEPKTLSESRPSRQLFAVWVRFAILFTLCMFGLNLNSPCLAQGTTGTMQQAPTMTLDDIGRLGEDKAAVVNPGPLEPERRALYSQIIEAEKRGIGTKTYISAFQSLEQSVSQGASRESLLPRVKSIAKGLSEQLERQASLKIQKPAPPVAASSPPPSVMAREARKNQLSKSELFEQIKEKWFGGEIPDSIKQKMPDGFDPSKLTPQETEELLKRLQ